MKKFLTLAVAFTLAACGANLNVDRYETSGAGTVNTVSEGVIVNVRPVTIATENGEVGQLAGGIVGGVAGSMVGDSTLVQTIGAVGGAVLGGYVGGKAQEGLSARSVTLTQGDDVVFTVGQSVYVLDADSGERARIIAR